MHESPLPLSRFSQVVESIYDAALDPGRWPQALALIAEISDSPVVTMGITDHELGRNVALFDHGIDAESLALYARRYAAMNPLYVAGHLRPVGSVYTAAMLVDEAELQGSALYREFAAPRGWRDFLGVHALRSRQRSAGLSAVRRVEQPRYGARDVELFSLLAPHLCRAFAISDALSLKTLACDSLEAVLDALSTGVLLLDRSGRTVHANRAAQHQLQAGQALRSDAGRPVARDAAAQAALAAQIRVATGADTLAPAMSASIALPAAGGTGLLATVLPLGGGRRQAVSAPFAAACALFLQDPQDAPPLPGEAFAKLHGLTAGELRVVLALMPGLTVKEAAQVLGISEATAKTHLHRVFDKTGTAKQAELMRLIAAAAPPLRAAAPPPFG